MTLDPNKSSLFGGKEVAVVFSDPVNLSTDGEYYIIFDGKQERHVTKATQINTKVLRAVVPEHHSPEVVEVTVICQQSNNRHNLVISSFTYEENCAHKLACHLVASVDNPMALEPKGHLKWNAFDLNGEDLGTLDEQLLKAFLEMKLPRDWNLLGDDDNLPEIPARESLLHFTARLGLQQLTEFFMYQPGSLDAVCLPNHDSKVPLDIAQDKQHSQVVNILLGKNYYGTGGPLWLEKWKKPRPSTMVQRHDNGMATITNDITQSKRTIDDDIKLLHNMSKVVYNDQSLELYHPHNTTRQRHSMAEDYNRQKLYYSDSNPRSQRHSMAEQRYGGTRLMDINIEQEPVRPESHGRRGANKPRLPSPDRKLRQDQGHISRSDKGLDDNVTSKVSQYSRSPLERSRERRPISATDRYSLEKQLYDDSYRGTSQPTVTPPRSMSQPTVLPPRRYVPSSNDSNVSGRRRAPDPPQQAHGLSLEMGDQSTNEKGRTRHYSGHELGRPSLLPQDEQESMKRQSSWEKSTTDGYNCSMPHHPRSVSMEGVGSTPHHPRSVSMEGVGSYSTGVGSYSTEVGGGLQTNSLGRKNKPQSHSFSLPPQDVATTYTSETVLHLNADRLSRPSSAGNRWPVTEEQINPVLSAKKPPLVPRQSARHQRSASMEGLLDEQEKPARPRLKSMDYSEQSDEDSFMSYDQGHRYKRKPTSQGEHHRRIYQKNTDKQDKIRTTSLDSVAQDSGDYVQVSHTPDGMSPYSQGQPVLEENLRRLQEIQDNIHRLREYGRNNENNRRDSLQRYSTSCPSLADKLLQSTKLVAIDDSEHHKSMQDLNREAQMSPPSEGKQHPLEGKTDIKICVNDVTVGTSSDFNPGSKGNDPEILLIEEMKRNQRRSSWCPEEERKKEEKMEKQSQSLSSLEGDDDDGDDDSDGSTTYGQHNKVDVTSPDDIQYMDVDVEDQEKPDESCTPADKPDITISSPGDAVSNSPGGVTVNSQSSHYNSPAVLQHRSSDGSLISPGSIVLSPNQPSIDGDNLSPGTLPKAASTPSINSNPDISVEDKKRSGSTGTANDTSPNVLNISGLSEEMVQKCPLVDEGGTDQIDKSAPRLSMLEFLNDPTNYMVVDPNRRDENKDDKKRKSVFSKFPSYRGKKIVKDNKMLPSNHQFVSVSFSNSTSCDVCGKSMANKSALQCENCMVNVHESTCKDQISQCTRVTRGSTKVGRFQSTSLPDHMVRPTVVGNLKLSQSFKEPTRNNGGQRLQVSQSATAMYNKPTIHRTDEGDDLSQTLPELSNLPDTLSVSMESIEEEQSQYIEVDNSVITLAMESEAWSVTVDKKTLKKMNAKDIKRQDHIWEFIQTEKSHCRTLNIMHQIFYNGLIKECELGAEMVDRIFPRLFELLDIHMAFLSKLIKLQQTNVDKSIDVIGDLLYQQFGGLLGDQMKQAYGEFCSRHHESVQLYKDILKENKRVQAFAKKCSNNPHCKRLDIPACILLVTQRTSKYPLLIESILKATKDYKEERENLTLALSAARDILEFVDRQIDEHEKYQKLIEIYNRVDARSYAVYKGTKFKKSGLLSNGRKLLHEGYVKWMNARGKATEVLAVILSDVIFFLAENNGKLSFFSQDNKSSVISLSKLLVREKGDTKDSKGIYLICQSKTEPEMYELVCKSADDRKYWIQLVKDATAHCFEEEVGAARNEEDRKLQEARIARLRQLVDQLRQRDNQIRAQCDEKMKLFSDMVDLYGGQSTRIPLKDTDGLELQDAEKLLQMALQQGEKLMSLLQCSTVSLDGSSSTSLSRSVSSVGEHSTGSTTPPLPKRAETFSGFENKDSIKVKKRVSTVHGNISDGNNVHTTESVTQDTKLFIPRRISVGVPYITQDNHKNNKDKVTRRSSTSFLQNLLTKQHATEHGGVAIETDDSDSVKSSDKSSEEGSTLDLDMLSPRVLTMSKEQCSCVAQLMYSVHGLACIASQESTEAQSLRAQLAEANAKVSQLYSETDRIPGFQEKRTVYHHDKQLEELRNLQELLNQERSQFDKERTQQNLEIHHERQDIKKERDDIDKQRNELKSQREELQRQKEALQKQMDLFEEQKSQFLRTKAAEVSPGQRERSQSPASSGGGSLERSHKRTNSNEIFHSTSREGSPFEGLPQETTKLKTRSNSSSGSSKSSLPLHLASAHVTQKLPLKLAGKPGPPTGKPGPPTGKPGPPMGKPGPQTGKPTTNPAIKQVFPLKLSSISSQTGSHGNSPKQVLTHTKSQPLLSSVKKTQLVPHNSSSSLLPMKLAEKNKTIKSAPPQTTDTSKTPAKKENEIFYF